MFCQKKKKSWFFAILQKASFQFFFTCLKWTIEAIELKIEIKSQWHGSSVFIVKFEQILHIVLVFPMTQKMHNHKKRKDSLRRRWNQSGFFCNGSSKDYEDTFHGGLHVINKKVRGISEHFRVRELSTFFVLTWECLVRTAQFLTVTISR